MTETQDRPSLTMATRLAHWRTIELLTATFVGVVFGIAYWGWNVAYTPISEPLTGLGGALKGLLGGPWLVAGVVGALVVRRPGAALVAEVLAAAVSALLGNQWGWSTLISGGLQGLGVELAFLLFAWRRFGVAVAMLGGVLAAFFEFLYEWNAYWQGTTGEFKIWYVVLFMISGAVVAGIGGWMLSRALARTGALDALPSGLDVARERAV